MEKDLPKNDGIGSSRRGGALHSVEDLLMSLHRGSGEPFEGLGDEWRDENGELKQLEFSSSNPYMGQTENQVHADGTETQALFTAPQPCPNGSPMKQLNLENFPVINWNYSPSITSAIKGLSGLSSICVYFEGVFQGLDINSAPNRLEARNKRLAFPNVKGISCINCFSYFGAALKVALTCTTGSVNTCHFGLSGGGGLQLNLDLEIDNPTISGDSGDQLVYNASESRVLYSNPLAMMKIKAKPYIYARMNGQLTAQGKAAFKANFNSSAGIQLYATSPLSMGIVGAGISGHLSMNKPTWTSTLQAPEASLKLHVTPLVMWGFEFGKMVSIGGVGETGFTTSMQVGTALTSTFDFLQRSSSSSSVSDRQLLSSPTSCTSNQMVTVTASLQSINQNLKVAGKSTPKSLLSGPLNTGDQLVYAALPGDTCLSAAAPTMMPTFPTAEPSVVVDALGITSAVTTGRMSSGTLAVCILLPLVIFLFLVIWLRNYCKRKKEDSLPACIPLHYRQRITDCFVSRRRESQAQVDSQREAERVDQRQQQAASYNLGYNETYERGTTVSSVHLSDLVPSPHHILAEDRASGINKGLPLPVDPRRLRPEQSL